MSNTTVLDSDGNPIPNCIWCHADKEKLLERNGKYGQFFYCTECKETFNRNQVANEEDEGFEIEYGFEQGCFGAR